MFSNVSSWPPTKRFANRAVGFGYDSDSVNFSFNWNRKSEGEISYRKMHHTRRTTAIGSAPIVRLSLAERIAQFFFFVIILI